MKTAKGRWCFRDGEWKTLGLNARAVEASLCFQYLVRYSCMWYSLVSNQPCWLVEDKSKADSLPTVQPLTESWLCAIWPNEGENLADCVCWSPCCIWLSQSSSSLAFCWLDVAFCTEVNLAHPGSLSDIILHLISALHENTGAHSRVWQKLSSRISTTSGVNTGLHLSTHHILCCHWLDNSAHVFNPGMTVGFSTFTDLVYADDTALLLPSATDATTSLKSFSDSASHLGQRQNYRTLVQALNHQGPNLQNILRQSYDNAKVTIDLRWTANLQNILRREQRFS